MTPNTTAASFEEPALAASPLPALGRILSALIFVLAGISHLGRLGATSASMASHGIPFADVLVWGVVFVELVGGLMLATGFCTRWAALVLSLYTLALALLFHAYWTMPPAEARAQHAQFFEHLAMIGGLLYVVAFGPGAYSVDRLIGRRTP